MSVLKHSSRGIALVSALAFTLAGAGTAHAAAGRNLSEPAARTKPAHAQASTAAQAQAAAQASAKKTGKPVSVANSETATTLLTANPDGSFTLSSAAEPQRTLVGGTWRNLDPTLKKNPDGTLSPTLAIEPLTISGGGEGPLATMASTGGDKLALSLPATLPAPSVTGSSATYRNVLPGVDVTVTVNTQGGFSDVYTVHTPQAAANPKLASLLSAHVAANGVHVTTDAAGDIAALDAHGRAVFTAPAPAWWDSETTAAAARTGAAPGTASSAILPGSRAHVGHLTARMSGTTLTLTPDQAMSSVPASAYPVYDDPSWSGPGGALTNKGWSTVSENYPGDTHYDSSPEQIGDGLMQVGNSPGGFWADSLVNFGLPLAQLGAEGTSVKINSAAFYISAVATASCSAVTNYLYAPAQTLVGGPNTNATWNDWFTSGRNLGSAISSAGVENYPPGNCAPNSGHIGFQMTTSSQLAWISADVAANKAVQTLALAGASYSDEESGEYAAYNQNTPVLSINFVHGPATPDHLSTSPNQSIIGNGSVTLNAHFSDPDGGSMNAVFAATVNGHTFASGSMSVGNNTYANLYIPESTVNAAIVNTAYGQTAASTSMTVNWTVSVTYAGMSAVATGKAFTYSTAVPGAPDIWMDSADSVHCNSTDTIYTVGQPLSFYVTDPAKSGQVAPTSYTYQLNGEASQTVAATNGSASFSLVPTSDTDVITVDGIALSTNVGQPTSCLINAADAADAAPGDLTGNGSPSLLLPGNGSSALPDGLWLSAGSPDGTVSDDAVNIGANGDAFLPSDTGASTFRGTQVISGLFQGSGYNDVLTYNPNTQAGTGTCSGSIINANGQTTPLDPTQSVAVLSSSVSIPSSSQNGTSTCATSIGNGGNLYAAEGGGVGIPIAATATSYSPPLQPDLLEVINGTLTLVGSYNAEGAFANYQNFITLSPTNPTGTGTWTGWSITSIDTPSDIPAMFAYNGTSIYYYSPADMAQLAFNAIDYGQNTVTPVALSGLTPGSFTDLQATTVDGTPGLYAAATVLSTGFSSPSWAALTGISSAATAVQQVSTYTMNGTTLATIGTPATLNTSTHTWALNDAADHAAYTTAADAAGTLPLTAHGAVTGNTADAVYSPDAAFDGKTGYLAAGSGAVDPGKDYSISAWVKPLGYGGSVASQAGSPNPVFNLYSTSGGAWALSMNTSASGSGNSYTIISGGHVNLGVWTQLVATYNQATGFATLYADGNEIAVGRDTSPPTLATGDFALGALDINGTYSSYFDGFMANVQTYASVATPLITDAGASEFVPVTPTRIIDTRSTSKIGNISGPVGANSTTAVQITGTAPIPTTGVTAVAMSLTVTGATAIGYLTVAPDDTPQPLTSTVNFGAGTTETNNAITPVGNDGKIDVYNVSGGTTQFLIDITGYYTTDTTTTGASTYTPLPDPARILDTRNGTGAAKAQIASGSTLVLPIAGNTTDGADIATSGVTAVAINITALDSSSGIGQLVAYPDGTTRPDTSNINYASGQADPSTVVVPVGADGKIDIYNQSTGSATDIIGDVSGYYTTGTTGQYYFPTGSDRVLDTRAYNPSTLNASPLSVGGSFTLPIPATAVAADPTLVLNITVTDETGNGNLDVYPAGESTPVASALNWSGDQTVANLDTAASTADGGVDFLDQGGTGTIDVIVDTDGYLAYATANGRHDAETNDWPLTDGAGSTAANTANANLLSFAANGATWTTSDVGPEDTATNVVDLDGASQYGQSTSPAVNAQESFTVGAWAEFDGTSLPTANATVVAQNAASASWFYLQYNTTYNAWCMNFLTDDNYPTTGDYPVPCASSAPTTNTWYHLVGTYNAATDSASLYVNGKLAATDTGISPLRATPTESDDLTVGAAQFNGQTTDYFPGKISNVQTFNYALGATQAQQLYDQDVSHDWTLTDGTGTTAADAAGTSPLSLDSGAAWTTSTVGTQTSAGNVLLLNGTTADARAAGPVLNSADSYTVSAWADPTAVTTGSQEEVADLCGVNQCAINLEINANGEWELSSAGSDGSGTATFTSTEGAGPATLNTWTHIVGVYDGAAKTLSLYINGTLAQPAVPFSTAWNATGDFTVGAADYSGSGTGLYFNGEISNVQTYPYALDPTQVGQLN